ncbi:MAG: hypothetical protein RBQ87_01320 [Candidatus Cloacimonadaceae bacterium]|jgi:hypothetical protein|nr:hypothetical protein [Candidatus Cloacimonadaceae bacterium]
MRLYGRKFVDRFVDKKVSMGTESRDAVLWSVDTVAKVARVKIQGSGKLVTAHYPRNWFTLPYFMKIGNAVRVVHRGGIRGYIEIAGEGRSLPMPMDGSQSLPDNPVVPEDKIISGMELSISDEGFVQVTAGIYQIDGTYYSYSGSDATVDTYVVMGVDPVPVMGVGVTLMCPIAVPENPVIALPAWDDEWGGYSFRYIAIFLGADGPFITLGEISEGSFYSFTPAEEPLMPDTPNDTILMGVVLAYSGKTTYTTADLNVKYTTPKVDRLFIEYESDPISECGCPYPGGEPAVLVHGGEDGSGLGAWQSGEYGVECNGHIFDCPSRIKIIVHFRNQYGWDQLNPNGEKWELGAVQLSGSGNSSVYSTGRPSIYEGTIDEDRVWTFQRSGASVLTPVDEYHATVEIQYTRETDPMELAREGFVDPEIREYSPLFRFAMLQESYGTVRRSVYVQLMGDCGGPVEVCGPISYMPEEFEENCYIICSSGTGFYFKNFQTDSRTVNQITVT